MVRMLVALTPLAASLAFAWLLMGSLSLGGGEKDVLLSVPPLLWSLVFFLVCLAQWWRRVPLKPTVAWAAGIATAVVVVALLGLLVFV
jgi:hypothetical protein